MRGDSLHHSAGRGGRGGHPRAKACGTLALFHGVDRRVFAKAEAHKESGTAMDGHTNCVPAQTYFYLLCLQRRSGWQSLHRRLLIKLKGRECARASASMRACQAPPTLFHACYSHA